MFSKFFGKRDSSEAPPAKGVTKSRTTFAAVDKPASPLPGINTLAPIAARNAANAASGFDTAAPAVPAALVALELELRKTAALEMLEQRHERIANTIRTMWGYKDCSVYINRLIMAGGDGMGHARVGFNKDVVDTMLALSDIHDIQFGPPDTLSGALDVSV
jgi:hypothetical protein